jgi:hypothetical protein
MKRRNPAQGFRSPEEVAAANGEFCGAGVISNDESVVAWAHGGSVNRGERAGIRPFYAPSRHPGVEQDASL